MGLTPILPSKYASVLELEDSPDLGSGAQAYGFESLQRHKCSISIAVIMRPCQGRDDGSIPLCCSKIGVYLLSLIRSRKSKWLHVGSNPITPTKLGYRIMAVFLILTQVVAVRICISQQNAVVA